MATLYRPDAVYLDGELRFGAGLAVSDDGVVMAEEGLGATTVPLPGRVLFPGLVNAHSHAFQRVLRGRTEYLAPGREREDFWTWREAMYDAAAALDPEQLYIVSRQAFLEMALAGITTVGEFHYLHHGPDGRPYADRHELAVQVMRAASDVGSRLVLLRAVYARAGFNTELDPRQRRFIDADVESALAATEELRARAGPRCTIGLAPHSVRAVPRPWLESIAKAWAGGPLHVHAAEQPAEVRSCLAEHGLTPVALLDEVGLLRAGMTLIHAVHLAPADVERLARTRRLAVCACPSTERDLGDGVVPADTLLEAGVSLCLGSDSQALVDLLDEARQLEGHLRLLRLKRNVLAPRVGGGASSLGGRLLEMATLGGARSLGVPVGSLEPGCPADFFTIDRNHPCLLGLPRQALTAGVAFAATPASVREVAVQGELIVRDGHPLQEVDPSGFCDVVSHLAGR